MVACPRNQIFQILTCHHRIVPRKPGSTWVAGAERIVDRPRRPFWSNLHSLCGTTGWPASPNAAPDGVVQTQPDSPPEAAIPGCRYHFTNALSF